MIKTINNTNTDNYNDRFSKIKKILNNTETLGNSTLIELNKQSEQIKTINKKSNMLFEQLKITKTKLNKIISSMSLNNLFMFNDIMQHNSDNIEEIKTNNDNIKLICSGIIENNQITNCDIDHISIKLEKLRFIANDMNNEIKEQNLFINDLSSNINKLNNITHQNNNIINK